MYIISVAAELLVVVLVHLAQLFADVPATAT